MASTRINHYCIICGKGYHACDSCAEIRELNPWKLLADTPNCFQIYAILDQYKSGRLDKEAARERLSHRNLKDKDTFKESAKKLINEILDNPKKSRKRKPVVETIDIPEAGTQTTPDIVADNTDTNDCE